MNPVIEEYTGEKLDEESYVVDKNLPEYIEENKGASDKVFSAIFGDAR